MYITMMFYFVLGAWNGVVTRLKKDFSATVDVGGCSLHHVHNAAHYAVTNSDMGVEELAQDIYSYFKFSAPEKERFQKV
jgi:hypothetical protein